ncbi:MAG: hypothetical protein WBE26_04845, partial [Phycisphaerae bacterium]
MLCRLTTTFARTHTYRTVGRGGQRYQVDRPTGSVAGEPTPGSAGPIITNREASLGTSEDFYAWHNGTRLGTEEDLTCFE